MADAYLKVKDNNGTLSLIREEADGSFTDLKNALNYNKTATPGYILRATDEGTGQEWAQVGTPTDAQTADAVSNWLNAHPEATTTVQDESLSYKKLIPGTLGFVTPEMYGAKGDGETDDRLAIIAAIQSGKPVVFDSEAIYAVGASIYPTDGGEFAELYGCGCQIKVIADFDRIFRLVNAVKISGFKLNMNSHSIQMGILVNNTNDVVIEDVEIYGLQDINTSTSSQMIYINGCRSASLYNISIHDCTKRANGTIADGPGALNGIYATGYKSIVIDGARIVNNHNVDANGNIVLEDCDGIYLRNTDEESSSIIQNVYGYNCGKRLIKSQCTSIIVDHIQLYTNGLDFLAGIAIQDLENGWGKRAKGIITNCTLVNSHTTSADQSMISTSEDIIVANCYIDGGTHNWGIMNSGDLKISNCKMYHNGIYNKGRTIEVDSVYFSGGVFIAEYSNSSTLENTFVINCDLYFVQKYGINTNFFQHVYGDAFYKNNRIHGYGRMYVGSTAGITRLEDCEFIDAITGDLIDIYGGSLVLRNVTFKAASGTTGIRAIYLHASTVSCDADGVKVDSGFNYSFVGSGSLTAKNTDMNKVYANSMSSCYFYPEYYTALPTRAQNNFLCLLTTDGKLYKYTSGTWTAVN